MKRPGSPCAACSLRVVRAQVRFRSSRTENASAEAFDGQSDLVSVLEGAQAPVIGSSSENIPAQGMQTAGPGEALWNGVRQRWSGTSASRCHS